MKTEKQSQNPDILGSLESPIRSPYTKCLLNLTILMQISKWLCFANTDLSPVHTKGNNCNDIYKYTVLLSVLIVRE